ncbi:hypothetical protein DK26_18160 [Bosea sp. WAO]|nr:hypothetical protein DK26_18160 [Bosea sp. WAO]
MNDRARISATGLGAVHPVRIRPILLGPRERASGKLSRPAARKLGLRRSSETEQYLDRSDADRSAARQDFLAALATAFFLAAP